MATKKINTKAPSGLSIARSNLTYTFSWKIADKDYKDGQLLQYRTNGAEWTDVTVGNATTKKSITLISTDYYPTTTVRLKELTFRVRGKRKTYTETHGDETTTYKPDWSDWSTKTLTFGEPEKATLEATLDSSNKTIFSWNIKTTAKDNKPFTNAQWQTIRVKDSKVTDGSTLKWTSSNAGWDTGTGTATDSETVTENSTLLINASYTRWFRVRSRGPRGFSDWRYAKHIYSYPYKAIISSAKATVKNSTTTITVKWTVASNAAHPIDSTTVEYLIATPAASLAVPAGATWTSGISSNDTTGTDAAKFNIGSVIGLDKCLWVRVATQHDSNIIYSSPKLVLCGALTAPTNLSVSADNQTYLATVAATNNSAVPDSRLAILFTKKGWAKPLCLGYIAHGDASATVQCPSWTNNSDISFAVYAFQGSVSRILKNSVYRYAVNANMISDTLDDGGDVPSAPKSVTATVADGKDNEVILTWDWSWKDADSAEISWSQNPDAWESTDPPKTYSISNISAGQWRVSGLQTGVKWYFRVRLAIDSNLTLSYGPYSNAAEVDLSSAPEAPVLLLSQAAAPKNSTITASWGYVSTDSTSQAYAEICKATISGGVVTYGAVVAHCTTAQHIDLKLKGSGWVTGTTYHLCVRVTSNSGRVSDWSEPVPITVADAVSCTITQTSLSSSSVVIDYNPTATPTITSGTADSVEVNAETFAQELSYTPDTYSFSYAHQTGVWTYGGSTIDPDDYGLSITGATTDVDVDVVLTTNPSTVTETLLTGMPLTVTATGAGTGGTTTVVIERAEEYHVIRPDDSMKDGYEGETIAIKSQDGESQIMVKGSELIGALDDGARYRMIVSVQDKFGQSASASVEFLVAWSHQALVPDATVAIEGLIAKITPTAPVGVGQHDVCDIYRLSADRPELIIKDAEWGTAYVDPYPALGETAGHRVVLRTYNGDYITAGNQPAWTDVYTVLDEYSIIIDFDGYQLILPYDITLSNKWNKDFKVTNYLGGSQQGDWNPAVTRTATYNFILMADEDAEIIDGMRALADYSGICHVRTPEGSSYAADVQVNESKEYRLSDKASYTLTVTRVDPEKLDGVTYEEWTS